MEVITLEDKAFKSLQESIISELKTAVKQVLQDHLKEGQNHDTWISGAEAMKLLNIKSNTTLAKLRSANEIMYSQATGTILYWKESLLNYIKKHANEVK